MPHDKEAPKKQYRYHGSRERCILKMLVKMMELKPPPDAYVITLHKSGGRGEWKLVIDSER